MEEDLHQADVALRLKTVDAVYGAVLEPAHYTAIIEAVNALFADGVTRDGDVAPVAAHLASLATHVTSASRLFEMTQPERRSRLQGLLAAKPFAAMAATEAGQVVMSNPAATEMLGALDRVDGLPLRADAHAEVRTFLKTVSRSGTAAPVVVSGWSPAGDRALLFVLQVIDVRWQDFGDVDERRRPSGPVVLVKSTETRLSSHVWRLTDAAFGLTAAEQDIVRELTNGLSLREIASRRSRSLNTIKTQLRAVLAKTGTRTQGQLLCMVTALAHLAEASEPLSYVGDPLCAPRRGSVVLRSAALLKGGTLKYVEMGARDGRPVLLLAPTNRPDFTSDVVDALFDRNLRVICPVRPGSWGTPRWPQCSPRTAAPLFFSLLDELSLGRVVLAGLRTGGAYAVELAQQAPDRFRGLLLIDTGAPLDRMSKFVSMPPWPRSLYTTARLFPELLILPFRYCASDFYASKQGERRAIETFYRDSPTDEHLLRDRRYYQIARQNLAYYFENPDQVARDIGFWARDWSRDLEDVAGRMAVRFLHGSENTAFPARDLITLCEQNGRASARVVAGTAMFLIYQMPDIFADELDRVESMLDRASGPLLAASSEPSILVPAHRNEPEARPLSFG